MATWTVVGLIWFVQIVHYPLLAQVGTTDFRRYEAEHRRRTGVVVALPWTAEIVTGFDPSTHRRLVATNWVRTGAWTLRGVLAAAMVAA